MADDLSHEAQRRLHSTVSDALLVGEKANAFRIVLTHFSQRYPEVPVDVSPKTLASGAFQSSDADLSSLDKDPLELVPVPAFDLMTVNFKTDLIRLPLIGHHLRHAGHTEDALVKQNEHWDVQL